MDYKAFFKLVDTELGITSNSSYLMAAPDITMEILLKPSDILLAMAEAAAEYDRGYQQIETVEFNGDEFQIVYVSDHGSIQHDGAEINAVYAVFKGIKFQFYFRVYGTYSSWNDPVWDDSTEWEVVNPEKVEAYVWSIR